MQSPTYPIFLQFDAIHTWYKIINDHSFIEVKTLGSYYFLCEYSDDIMPMHNHISDLIKQEETKEVSEQTYQDYLDYLKLEKIFRAF